MKHQYALIFESKADLDEAIIKLSKQQNQSQLSDKPCCEDCGKAVDQKVVNYCKIQFDGHTYCRDCQKNHREEP